MPGTGVHDRRNTHRMLRRWERLTVSLRETLSFFVGVICLGVVVFSYVIQWRLVHSPGVVAAFLSFGFALVIWALGEDLPEVRVGNTKFDGRNIGSLGAMLVIFGAIQPYIPGELSLNDLLRPPPGEWVALDVLTAMPITVEVTGRGPVAKKGPVGAGTAELGLTVANSTYRVHPSGSPNLVLGTLNQNVLNDLQPTVTFTLIGDHRTPPIKPGGTTSLDGIEPNLNLSIGPLKTPVTYYVRGSSGRQLFQGQIARRETKEHVVDGELYIVHCRHIDFAVQPQDEQYKNRFGAAFVVVKVNASIGW